MTYYLPTYLPTYLSTYLPLQVIIVIYNHMPVFRQPYIKLEDVSIAVKSMLESS